MKQIQSAAPERARILVVLEPHIEGARLLRSARRKASARNLDWEVLVFDAPGRSGSRDASYKENILSMITLAQQMGGIVTKCQSTSVFRAVKEVVAERIEQHIPIYSIKVADINNVRSWAFFRKPLEEKLEKAFKGSIPIVSVPLGAQFSEKSSLLKSLSIHGKHLLISLIAVFLATVTIELIDFIAPEAIASHHRNKSIIYVTACAFVAGRYGLIAGIVTSLVSFLTLNLVYVSPNIKLMVNSVSDAVNLSLFFLVSFFLSLIGSQNYGNRVLQSKRAERFHSLLKVHRLALSKSTAEETIATLEGELKSLLGSDIAFFMPTVMDEHTLENVSNNPMEMNEAELKALYVSWNESKTTGVGAPYHPTGCRWRFEPLVTASDDIGVLGVRITSRLDLDVDFGRLMAGIADQVALILERLQLGQIAEASRIQAEREKLRSMLLSSVSHDLKTPLASVIGSLSVFRSMGPMLSDDQRTTLITTALDEAQRLDSFITNILDMTKIESGQIELKSEWVRPEDLMNEVRKRLRDRLREHEFIIIQPDQEAEVSMDAVMTAQVIQNLLDNAVKYTKAGTRIELSWHYDHGQFELSVRDYGAGIPSDQIEKVFDKYSRIKRQDSQVAGTGLGLAISRAIMQAQGGGIKAENHEEGGMVFTITLPNIRNKNTKKAA